MSTIAQLKGLKDRRQQRALQKAQYGISADPSILMELDQLETIISLMERIDIHRRNLDLLARQNDHFGAHVPVHIVNQIRTEREQIAALRTQCARLGQPVEPHPLDTETDAPPQNERESAPLPVDPLTLVRERLRDIEAMLRHGQYQIALEMLVTLQQEIK